MKKIIVKLGMAPNGKTTWVISYASNLVRDKTCALEIEKSYLDANLPETSTKEEYHFLVAKEMAKALEEKMINPNDIENYVFKCVDSLYQKGKPFPKWFNL